MSLTENIENGDDTPNWITDDFLKEILKSKYESKDEFTITEKDIALAVKKGDNFLSLLQRVRIYFRRNNSTKTEEAHIVVKSFPPGEFMQTFVQEIGVFEREEQIYKEALPLMYKFADEKMGSGSFKRFSAKIFETTRPNTIVLEDLKEQGFQMADRKKRLDLEHGRLVIRNIARLHALSFAYEAEHPHYFRQFNDKMFGESNRERLLQFLSTQLTDLAEVVKTWPGFEAVSEKIRALEHTCVDRLVNVCRLRDFRFNILNHGDCWVNNILFKYSEEGHVEDLRFVDFQTTRYGSLAVDLSYFMYTSLRIGVRARHVDLLLEEYCEEFRNTTLALGCKEEPIGLKELREEMKNLLFMGFVSSLTTMAIVIADSDDTPDLSELKIEEVEKGLNVFEKVHSSPMFREAFQDLLPHFDKMGVLD